MAFDLQPTLKGDRIELRPLRADDFSALYAVASDPLIWEQHPKNDRYQRDVFEAFFKEAIDSGGALVVINSEKGEIIGSSRFHGYDERLNGIEIGWTFLARAYWGGSYNREMKELMLDHAFQFVRYVFFLVGTQNFRSQRAMAKIGGVPVGQRVDGSGVASIAYLIKSPAKTPPSANP